MYIHRVLSRMWWFPNSILYEYTPHKLQVLKSEWRETIIIPVAIAVDANFIRWSFNSYVTVLERNLLDSGVMPNSDG